MQTNLFPIGNQFLNGSSTTTNPSAGKSTLITAYDYAYLNTRTLHTGELTLFQSQVLIEDRLSAQQGKLVLKERFAVLCPTRLLLFKHSYEKTKKQQALAVYPLVNTDFEILDAPKLTRQNLGTISKSDDFNDLN